MGNSNQRYKKGITLVKQIRYKRAHSSEELHQILALQRANIPTAISDKEKQQEGFVTVHHSFEILNAMNQKCPHIIATYDENVVGYALCMLQEFKHDIEVLRPMFKQIDKCLEENVSYLVMGQICIDKNFRKQGIFRGLYNFMKQELNSQFDMVVTEVDEKNTRSMQAHYAIGFQRLYTYNSNQQDWALISWDWNQ